jgi:hypothetical protein
MWPKGVLREETARDAASESVEVALYGVLILHKELQERVRAAKELEETLRRQCEELRTSLTETHFEGERAIRQIKELENKVRENTATGKLWNPTSIT